MFKKLFKIGMLVGLMAVACTANAQEEKHYAVEYPHYGFWSNWSIGAAPSWSWQSQFNNYKYNGFGLMLFAEKELSPVFDVRLALFGPITINWAINKFTDSGKSIDSYGELGMDFKINLASLCNGYNPERKFNTYFVAGSGVSVLYDGGPGHNGILGNVGVYIRGGLGFEYRFNNRWSMFAEYMQDIVNDAPNPFKFGSWHNTNGHVIAGLMYNFGPTQADLDLIAQRALLTQENFDRMNDEINSLRDELKNAKEREKKLLNRISDLEEQIANMQPIKKDDKTVDSLQRIINGYENNKHNFYALPFSITYDVDQYTVSEDQMRKVNAIAQVMKDDESINYEIIGYCDYTGSDEYNQKLSERRAEYVKKLLVRKGISEDRLTTSGKGKTMPFGDIKNSINRRVSFYRSNN